MNRTHSSTTAQSDVGNHINSQSRFTDNMLQRDKEQSHRLHEPTSIESHTDPVTGNDVPYTEKHPRIVDGILTVYFESEDTRDTYVNTPVNHPFPKLTNQSTEDVDRGG